MEKILVCGASGSLGRHILDVLKERGYWTRALCRNAARCGGLAANEIHIGDALNPSSLAAAFSGVDTVFSCLGQTVSDDMSVRRPGYMDLDLPANLNLLEAAKSARVGKFVYVSVLNASKFPNVAYLAAHAKVAEAVKASGLNYGVVEPSGFFSAFKAVHNMVAKNQAVLFGKGASRSNPIHDRDLAEVCVDVLADSKSVVQEVGGPEVYSRREIFDMAFAAQGKPVKIMTMPQWMPGVMAAPVGLFAPRIGDLMGFIEVLSAHDFPGPKYGSRLLPDYFQALAAGGRGRDSLRNL